jgi:hypothetical protein
MPGNVPIVLDRFRSAATNFIQTVDSSRTVEREVFLASVSHRLAELYHYALDLPAVEPETASIDETPASSLCVCCRSVRWPCSSY